MKLKIIQSGTKRFPYYVLMTGDKEFCATDNFINAQTIVEAIGEMKPSDPPKTLSDILQKIQDQTGVDLTTELSRERHFVNLRIIFCKIASSMKNYTFNQIGEAINRDHSTVTHSLKKFEDYYQTDRKFRELYESIT